MSKYTTKLFGEISIDETEYNEGFFLVDNEIAIGISFNCNTYKDKIKKCFNLIDKFFEIKKITEEIIMKRFIENKTFRYYFVNSFELYDEDEKTDLKYLDEFNINDFVKRMQIANLAFYIENDKIKFTIDYGLYGYFNELNLYITIDEQLNVIDCSYR
jgi:hypothetical protein